MELDFQLTPRSRILLAILGGVLLLLLAIQGVPALYRLFTNRGTAGQQEQLLKTQNLVHVAEVLKPIEFEIYKATGLALAANQPPRAGAQRAATLFDIQLPETVIRERLDALVKRAGIQQNYQLLTKPGTAKQTQKLTAQHRKNLVLYLYLKHIETEATNLAEMAEQEAEDNTFDMLMDAWLSVPDEEGDEPDDSLSAAETGTEKSESTQKARPENPIAAAESTFVSLPEVIPLPLRVKLAGFIKDMVTQQLRGATDFKQDFFEAQVHRVKTPATPGTFGIGAKSATLEIQLRKDSALLDFLIQAADKDDTTSPDMGEYQSALVKYIEEIQKQRAMLLEQLALAPLNYQTEHYAVEMKFKTDLEKLVNLNHLIEQNAKWLTVRDLRISADKQTNTRPAARRGRDAAAGTTNLNIDILFIARIF